MYIYICVYVYMYICIYAYSLSPDLRIMDFKSINRILKGLKKTINELRIIFLFFFWNDTLSDTCCTEGFGATPCIQ